MTITCDTSLEEILDSNSVCDAVISMNTKTQSLIESRAGTMANCLQSGGGLGEDQIIDNVPVFYNSGKEILDKYVTISENVASYATTVCQLAVDREMYELGELSTAVQKKIAELDTAIEAAQQAVEDSLQQGSQFAMVSPEVELAELLRERQKYVDKLDAIGARIKALDPSAEVAVAPPLPDFGGDSGAEDDGAGEEEEKTPGEEEGGEEPPEGGEEPPADDASSTTYTIPTEGKSTDEMYQAGRQLETAVAREEEYLCDAIEGVEYNISLLNEKHENGEISEETYQASLAEYNAQLDVLNNALYERMEFMGVLQPAVVNNPGVNDGWLADSRDTAFFGGTLGEAGNEQRTAERVNSEINAAAANLTPIDQVVAEAGVSGTSPLNAGTGTTNTYNQPLASTQYNYADYSSISPATQRAAYDYATHSQTATEVAPGVYVYSVKDYLSSSSHLMPPNMGTYAASEFYTTDCYTFDQYVAPDGSGDTVYDSNTGEYSSWSEWSAKQGGK